MLYHGHTLKFEVSLHRLYAIFTYHLDFFQSKCWGLVSSYQIEIAGIWDLPFLSSYASVIFYFNFVLLFRDYE